MGVWANGPSATAVDLPGIAAAMRPALYAWFSAQIRIYDPARYNASPEAALIFDSGADGALVQPLRAPSLMEFGGQPTALLGIRFQVKSTVDIPVESGQVLRGGLVVKVIDGGNAVGLERYVFGLPEVIDSSLSWAQIFEASVISSGV